MPVPCTPPPLPTGAGPPNPHRPSPDLAAFLVDLPLPACVFSHANLAVDLEPPTLVNSALQALLEPAALDEVDRTGEGDADGRAGRTLLKAMDDVTRVKLREWLVDGAAAARSSPPASSSSSSTAPTFPVPPALAQRRPSLRRNTSSTRHIALQLDPAVSFSKLRWRATVSPGFTVLTLLPSSEVAHGGGVEPSELAPAYPSTSSPVSWTKGAPLLPGADSAPATVQHARARLGVPVPFEPVGEHEISLDGARDALMLEGLAYTAWHAPVGVFRVNRDLSVTQANPKWRHTTGLAEGESNDAWPARIHPDDRERVLAHYRSIREHMACERDELEFRWLPDGGRDQWCVCVIEPAVIDGIVEGYVGFLINVSKHKEILTASEAQAAQLRSELATLSEYCSVGLSRHAIDGTFLNVNKAWWSITRLDPSLPLEAWRDQVHPDDRTRVFQAWTAALQTREPLAIQFRWKHGSVSLVQVSPNHPEKSKATGWVGSVTDTTAQARAEEAMLKLSKEREALAKAEAEEAEQRRKTAVDEKQQQELLIDVTSHEIRNPISAILQNADLTRSSLQSLRRKLGELKDRGALPSELDGNLVNNLDEDIEALDAITECGMAQERIANDILGLAQIQLSKYSITPVEFGLPASLRNICRMFKSECRSKDIELRLVIGSSLARLGPQARVFADPARLTQILVNLLSNAIRFTAKSDRREVTLAVEVSSQAPDRGSPLIPPHETEYHIDKRTPIYLFFSVEDTGLGMTEEETSRLFAKFMQASPLTHTAWGGSGLGLWIARNLCELQAGRIEVASTVGKGSIFRCFITARSVDAGPDKADKPAPVIEGITGPNAVRGAAPRVYLSDGSEQNAPLRGFKVLCCEDNLINRTILRRQLAKEGCDEVLLACDGQEGINLLRKQPAGAVHCVLMDIEMPIMDGLAATRAIRQAERQDGRAGRQRIVGLTGNARSARKQAALDAGMDAVVTKPYKVPDLVDQILSTQTAPPSPSLASSRPHSPEPSASSSAQEDTQLLSPTAENVDEPKVITEQDVSVYTITGERKPAEVAKRSAETAAITMPNHGNGKVLHPSQLLQAAP
ncbi:hypothetical protein JCM3770_001931 [Rhodotorula araucariae]